MIQLNRVVILEDLCVLSSSQIKIITKQYHMRRNILLLSLITLLISTTTVMADWEYPEDAFVYMGQAYSFKHLKKSYEHSVKIAKDAITPYDNAMIALALIEETDALLCAMQGVASDRNANIFKDKVMGMKNKVDMDLVSIYVINLSWGDAGKMHRLFYLTELIISAFLKCQYLQSYYPTMSLFVRNREIQTAYCSAMKVRRLEGEDVDLFANALLDLIEDPNPIVEKFSKGSSNKTASGKK